MESWSTVINVKITKSQMVQQLRDFKSKINFKKCNIGLISAPIIINDEFDENLCYEDNHELILEVKNIFPEITFLGAFCEDEDFYFGINSCNGNIYFQEIFTIALFKLIAHDKFFFTDSKEPIMNNNIISIIVISYD